MGGPIAGIGPPGVVLPDLDTKTQRHEDSKKIGIGAINAERP